MAPTGLKYTIQLISNVMKTSLRVEIHKTRESEMYEVQVVDPAQIRLALSEQESRLAQEFPASTLAKKLDVLIAVNDQNQVPSTFQVVLVCEVNINGQASI